MEDDEIAEYIQMAHLIRRYFKDVDPGQIHDVNDFLSTLKDSSLMPHQKRALLDKTAKNEAIWGIIFAFLTVPILGQAFLGGVFVLILNLVIMMAVVGPVTHKILFGTWFF